MFYLFYFIFIHRIINISVKTIYYTSNTKLSKPLIVFIYKILIILKNPTNGKLVFSCVWFPF